MPALIPTRQTQAIPRRAAMLLPWFAAALLAACADTPPPDFQPLDFGYLTKLRLTVAAIEVDDSWTPKPVADGIHVEALAPVQPIDALRKMAQQRPIPAGIDGHAVFVIDDASLLRSGGRFVGNLQVHLDISSGDGTKTGYAEARVSRTRTIVDDSADATRVALYELVKQMMADMNVEFEFQIRRSLRDYLQGGTETQRVSVPGQHGASLFRAQGEEMGDLEFGDFVRKPRPAQIGNVPGKHVERPYSAVLACSMPVSGQNAK